jgi:hypothetical protein
MRLRDLIGQLAERRVFRAAALYAAAVWVLLQAADVLAGLGTVAIDAGRASARNET